MKKHIVTALVENRPGVLARIVGLISGRGYNIETLNVAPTREPGMSKMTIVALGDDHVLEQVVLQVGKLVDIVAVSDVTKRRPLDRELILVEVAVPDAESRDALIAAIGPYRAAIASERKGAATVEMVGSQSEVRDFMRMLGSWDILDLSRSGVIAVSRAK